MVPRPAGASVLTLRMADNQPKFTTQQFLDEVRNEVWRERFQNGLARAFDRIDEARHARFGPRQEPSWRAALETPTVEIRKRYTIGELVCYHDDDFIYNAYRAVLHRNPDPAGRQHYLAGIRDMRFSKSEVLARLRFSKEGKARGVAIRGLLPSTAIEAGYRIPLLGYALRLMAFLVQIPRHLRTQEQYRRYVVAKLTAQRHCLNRMVGQVERELVQLRRHIHEQDRRIRDLAAKRRDS